MKTTLVIMAAGLGSRFSKDELKQLAGVGPHQEMIMEYSIYDAKMAGFNKVVLIIRKSMKDAFDQAIGSRVKHFIEVEYVYQELDALPSGFKCPEGRVKPFGTGHALLMCKEVVKEPFVVINADDYYGKNAFKSMHEYLVTHQSYCMAGFILKNTLSKNGGVSRGICEVKNGYLEDIVETTNIIETSNGAIGDVQDSKKELDLNCLVSMNMWGIVPSFFIELEREFIHFLGNMEDSMKSEFYLPSVMDHLIKDKDQKIAVLETQDEWLGVTYKQDQQAVQTRFQEMVNEGIYPSPLF